MARAGAWLWRCWPGIRLWAASALMSGAAWAGECREDQLWIRGDFGEARFDITLADTAEARSRGLMYVREMPADAGMLFVYEAPAHARFWMRNTLISLDMLFADSRGVLRRVHERAQPLDETVIDGGPGVRFVLEINGGQARALGIGPGAQMRHPAIGESAAWPCD